MLTDDITWEVNPSETANITPSLDKESAGFESDSDDTYIITVSVSGKNIAFLGPLGIQKADAEIEKVTIDDCSSIQAAGGDTPETRYIDLQTTSGTYKFSYETYNIKDRIEVIYEGVILYDTGCVGEDAEVTLDFSGISSIITVKVTPNCEGTLGTERWQKMGSDLSNRL